MSELLEKKEEEAANAAPAAESEYEYESGNLEDDDDMTDAERIQYLTDRGLIILSL